MKKKILAAALIAVLLAASLVLAACGTPGRGRVNMMPGTWTAAAIGYMGPVTVEVRTSSNAITSVRVTDHMDTPGVADWAIDLIPARIVEHQSLAVDIVTSVTITSMAIINAVEDCLRQAGADIAALHRPIRRARVRDKTLTADVIIVGGGGAGLAAAVAATDEGASVILIEKTGLIGGNSIVAGGIYNVANSRQQKALRASVGDHRLVTNAINETPVSEEHRLMQNRVRAEFEAHTRTSDTLFDSPAWFALQTWNGGDKVASLSMIYLMTSRALAGVEWLESMGMQFRDAAVTGPGSLYPRTLRAALPNGVGFIRAFENTLETRNNYTQFLDTTATGLIIEGGRVVGVNAVGRQGNRVTLRANRGVILATGGFAGNVEMRVRYAQGDFWPYLGPTLNTTNMPGVTGDGHRFAREAGGALVHMEHIQLFHIANPVTGSTGDINMGGRGVYATFLVNKEGRRFVREDGRRDEISQAIMAQPGGVSFQIMTADAVGDPNNNFTLDGRSVAFMVENNLSGFVKADTLEELAGLLGINADNLAAEVREFNSHVDSQTPDRLGRLAFAIRYETGPWYGYPRAPATHYTMGGVLIDEYTRVLRADGSPVPGLYAAGEITGVLHGSNRLGGNAITDFVVFGRIAGASAAARR